MEGICEDVERPKSAVYKPSTSQTGTRCLHGVVICLGLLSVFLVAGLIGLGVNCYYLTEQLQASTNQLSVMNSSLGELTKELNKVQIREAKRVKCCPEGWKRFKDSCYILSIDLGSWTEARQDCIDREADLVVVNDAEEQRFFCNFTKVETWSWIGLTKRETEGTWKWMDGTSLNLRFWETGQPDNGGKFPQWDKEDCAYIKSGRSTEENWNDWSCDASMRWICEKML
ncbi:C-type lectin domain family 4 member E-like [Mugil cephalus]|uniref:C-type lectin domain family 4 member E-like n=1 Tax=Mugil cephalus TaxID=48193 RepID=UPI001FB7F66A|nr:C-type lectin domain family 4 member E-like [Mugil cephalus]